MGAHPATNPAAYGQLHTANQPAQSPGYFGEHSGENPENEGEQGDEGDEEAGKEEPQSFYNDAESHEQPAHTQPSSGSWLAGEDEGEEQAGEEEPQSFYDDAESHQQPGHTQPSSGSWLADEDEGEEE